MIDWNAQLPGVYYTDGGDELMDIMNVSSGGGKYVILPDRTYQRVSGDAIDFLLSIGCKKPDGVSTLSEKVTISENLSFSNNQIVIELSQSRDLGIRVFSLTGQQLYAQDDVQGSSGINRIEMKDITLAQGVYLMQIQGKDFSLVHTFSVTE